MGKKKLNHDWTRVQGTPTPQAEKDRQERNKSTRNSPTFVAACKKATIEPSNRQARKFAAKRGLAYSNR